MNIANLGDLTPGAIDPLLAEQTAEWAKELNWDHSHAANLVRGLIAARRLGGLALMDSDEAVGYGYVGLEGQKGLIADIYIRPRWRSDVAEVDLLRALFDFLTGMPVVTRIEAQLMLMETASARSLERDRAVRTFERSLMKLDSGTALPPRIVVPYRIESWNHDRIPQAAEIIQAAYAGHVDAEIHERYSTVHGAESFLRELVQFPGASFHASASYLALNSANGAAHGLLLASFVAPGVGHIAELCISPDARGSGLGRELLRKSIEALRDAGATRVTLAVTVANERAVALYNRFGFREMRRFPALVWEKSAG